MSTRQENLRGRRVPRLPARFPFRETFESFIERFSLSDAYWYTPKWRSLGQDQNLQQLQLVLSEIIDLEIEDLEWDTDTQEMLLDQLIAAGVLNPYVEGADRRNATALVRIAEVLLKVLGFAWKEPSGRLSVTEAGSEFAAIDTSESLQPAREIISRQITKIQFPNPTSRNTEAPEFTGILPHLFLLQALVKLDGYISHAEFNLFLNLAWSQEDIDLVVGWIESWRDLTATDRTTLKRLLPQTRLRRVQQNASYQRALFAFPDYVTIADGQISIAEPQQVYRVMEQILPTLKLREFASEEEWIAYMGNPKEAPDWYSFLTSMVETAPDQRTATELTEEFGEVLELLEDEKVAEIRRKQVEKAIEDVFFEYPELLEPGLRVVERQKQTSIGRLDLLCEDPTGRYVVVEIKANEADDGAIGQILRYIGWIHRNQDRGHRNVRGILLAGSFPDKAYYARVGLGLAQGEDDARRFLKFKRHGMVLEDA
ncbi:MAG: AlwI family type II restriction endonuclease [Acidimicrobiales bacterium]|nr:AlwI family type II restriction endonuclease [Acidimicrobiales bacterium]